MSISLIIENGDCSIHFFFSESLNFLEFLVMRYMVLLFLYSLRGLPKLLPIVQREGVAFILPGIDS